MFVEVNLDGASENTLLNLEYVVRAIYERVSETQCKVRVAFADGTTISADDREGQALYDALMKTAQIKGGVRRIGPATSSEGKGVAELR